MRIVACGMIASAALLGVAPVAMAGLPAQPAVPDAPVSSSDSQASPQAEVSMLAVSLTVGGALATAGSGVALVLTRRRAVSRAPSQASG
ncbi:MAG: hypothetical protein M3186_05250 [Actinomycetota bacterium]|nr:hypothetical protein [Actinomycetota bacterium]